MAVAKQQARQRTQKRAPEADLGFSWGAWNNLLLALGLVVLIVGYVALSRGSVTLAPALLVLGYVVIIPGTLLIRGRKSGSGE
jgi:uncharacterized membrane protein HdeD (DUF308 family)